MKRADKIDKGLMALKSGIVLLIIAQQHAKKSFYRIEKLKFFQFIPNLSQNMNFLDELKRAL